MSVHGSFGGKDIVVLEGRAHFQNVEEIGTSIVTKCTDREKVNKI